MFAGHNNLNNLVAIMDRNFMCATDFTEECLSLEPLEDKFKSFNWEVQRINGNNIWEVVNALKYVRSRRSVKPKLIIADTVKGSGIKSTCDETLWHSRTPLKKEDIDKCRKELKDE